MESKLGLIGGFELEISLCILNIYFLFVYLKVHSELYLVYLTFHIRDACSSYNNYYCSFSSVTFFFFLIIIYFATFLTNLSHLIHHFLFFILASNISVN